MSKVDKMAAGGQNSVNTSKISNLSKTTGQKTLKQEQRLSNTRPGSKLQPKRPSSRLVKEGKPKNRKMISYLERDQLLDAQSFDNDSADGPRKKPYKHQDPAHFYADEQEEMLHVEDIEL